MSQPNSNPLSPEPSSKAPNQEMAVHAGDGLTIKVVSQISEEEKDGSIPLAKTVSDKA